MNKDDEFNAFQRPGKTRDGVANTIIYHSEPIKMFPNEPARHSPFIVREVHRFNDKRKNLREGYVTASDSNPKGSNARVFRVSMWRFEPV